MYEWGDQIHVSSLQDVLCVVARRNTSFHWKASLSWPSWLEDICVFANNISVLAGRRIGPC